MKYLLFAAILVFVNIGCFGQSDSPYIHWYNTTDSVADVFISNQKIEKSPMVVDNELCEVMTVIYDNKIFYGSLVYVTTCKEYIDFKIKHPEFIIPKRVASKFIKCTTK